MKEKSGQQDKDAQEGSILKTAGSSGEITAGLCPNSLDIRAKVWEGICSLAC